MSLIEKANPEEFLIFHFDPEEISDARSTEWTESASKEAVPTLEFANAGVREVTFTARFSDWGFPFDHIVPGMKTVRSSITWLRARQQPTSDRPEPPILLFTGLEHDLRGQLFQCVITSTTIKTLIHAGPKVMQMARQVIPGPGKIIDHEIRVPFEPLRADIEITLKEMLNPEESEGAADTIYGALQQGWREAQQ